MMSKHYLGTFESNASKAFQIKLLPVSRALTTKSTMAVVEFYGGGGGEQDIRLATELVNDLIMHGWRDILEDHSTE